MIHKFYRNFEEITGSVLLVVVCILAAVQVVSRYVFENPFSWTEELATYLFVYLSFIGASLALKKNEHFAMEILCEKLPETLRSFTKIFVRILIFLCCAIIFWYGCRLTINAWNVKTPALEISYSVPYAAVPLGGILMMLRSLEALVKDLSKIFSNAEDVIKD